MEVLAVDHGVPRGIVSVVGEPVDGDQTRKHRFSELANHHELGDRPLTTLAAQDGDLSTGVCEANNAPRFGRRLIPKADPDALADRMFGQANGLGKVSVEDQPEPPRSS
ncbi:hypothetical protein [Nocardioides hungaricus]